MARNSASLWWPRYVGDYARKTAHLSLAEHGAYALLLDHYYSTQKPLDANASVLHRVCRAFASDEQAAVDSVVRQFFVLIDGAYHNRKADEELAKRLEIKKNRSSAAYSRWGRNGSKSNASGDASAYANGMLTTTTTTYEEEESSLRSPSSSSTESSLRSLSRARAAQGQSAEDEFEAWYRAYPKHKGRGAARKAYVSARKLASAEVLLAGADRERAASESKDPRFVPYPATWLNQQRWLDEPDKPPGAAVDAAFFAKLEEEMNHGH